MVNTNKLVIVGIVIVIAVILAGFLLINRVPEDSWIKDENGLLVKHGNPSETPQEYLDQQEAIRRANEIYFANNVKKVNFLSQCLGTVHLKGGIDYVVDIVHVPRIAEDDLVENQCSNFLSGSVKHFVELDKNGEFVRIG